MFQTYPSAQKFRPYFTASELLEIISALKAAPTHKRLVLVQYLEGFLLKINHGIVSPAHTNQPSLEDKLGFTVQDITDLPVPVPHNLTGEAAYQKWLANPVSATPKEIGEAMDWRYRNNLMSPDEEKDYEQLQLSI